MRSAMTPPQGGNPVVQQRRLLSELRKLRAGAGLARKKVAEALDWSVSKLLRIETGAVGISKTDLTALLAHYGVTDTDQVNAMVQLSRSRKQAAWWDKYKGQYPTQFITFLGYEMSAEIIRNFHSLVVPDLLQTREYAHEVSTACDGSPERSDAHVDVLIQRQQLLDQQEPPNFFFIIDEGALRRAVGGSAVMRRQLGRLKELNRRPNITIQIVRYDAGAVCVKGPFGVYELPGEEDDYMILLELADGKVVIQQSSPQEAADSLAAFSRLEEMAASTEETDKIIDEIAASFADDEPTK
jgi:transcriptional regulator with XRE-family HTH domain